MNAAEEVFFERGLDNAKMDEVAERAELSKGLLYVYFENKDDLAHAVAHRGLERLIEMFDEVLRTRELGIDQACDLGAAYVEFARTYPNHFVLMNWVQARREVTEPTENAIKCENLGKKAIELTARAVANGVSDGSIRPDLDPVKTAISLYAQTHGVIGIAHSKSAKKELLVDEESLIASSLELLRHGLSCRQRGVAHRPNR